MTQARLHLDAERILGFCQHPQQQFEIRRSRQQASPRLAGQRHGRVWRRRFRNRSDEAGDIGEHAVGAPQERIVVAPNRLMRSHLCHRTALINVSYILSTVVMTWAAAE